MSPWRRFGVVPRILALAAASEIEYPKKYPTPFELVSVSY